MRIICRFCGEIPYYTRKSDEPIKQYTTGDGVNADESDTQIVTPECGYYKYPPICPKCFKRVKIENEY